MEGDPCLSVAQHEPSFAEVGDGGDSDSNLVFRSSTVEVSKLNLR